MSVHHFEMELNCYLELTDIIRFEPSSKVTNVFFDETNGEVISVRGGGTLGVVAKGGDGSHTFRMDHRGAILSLKFSPDHLILAVQQTHVSVELLSYNKGEIGSSFIQECKLKGGELRGFIWSHSDDLVLVTDQGIELYQVLKERVSTKYLRSYRISCCWFVWNPQCSFLLICTGSTPNATSFQPISFTPGHSNKLPKFDVEASSSLGSSLLAINDKDVSVGSLYGLVCIFVFRHPSSPTQSAFLDVYMQGSDNVFKLTHICCLEMTGQFAMNVVDNLIIVHHHGTKCSLLFDIHGNGKVSGGVMSLHPIAMAGSIMPVFLEEDAAVSSAHVISVRCELYSSTWVSFQPDIIIDARLGCMWHLRICLAQLVRSVSDKALLVDCLLRRSLGKSLIISVVMEEIRNGQLAQLGVIFGKINAVYRKHFVSALQSQVGEASFSVTSIPASVVASCVIIEQADMYSSVFAPLIEEADVSKMRLRSRAEETVSSSEECSRISSDMIIGVVLDYVRSLLACNITVQHFLFELIINALVCSKQFYQLHQLLQYNILTDSKPLACLLLSLVGVYPAGEQLSLDMMARLSTAQDEIIEVLLSHDRVTTALKYARSQGLTESVSARKFLEAAMKTKDEQVFFSVFTFFSMRNAKLRGTSSFSRAEQCDVYIDYYKKLFGSIPEYTTV